ncbi:formate dehydrogenase accessory protein FdhE [Leptothrix discophora]|uniref:Protein FdhE homolog n=1 Tax=Leptothrix discophora TaxID=89 RepID=A0ABT9G540_LEPDI|nr:formate dehydrogenase accessory protein FdhE [Leptothrix discophora]MDP4301606.1 formate dehydrogenase accessory protein FdhE [Leptothrix discophora]
MTATATVRVMTPEEIASRPAGETPYFRWPQRETLFAERAMRLRQLARGHAMGDFLGFMADLALAQHQALQDFPSGVPLPDAAALDRAAQRGEPPLSTLDWPRDPAWQAALRQICGTLRPQAPAPVAALIDGLLQASNDHLEHQADRLLTGLMRGLDLGTAPLIAAALQVYWTHLVLSVQRAHIGGGQPFGRPDDHASGVCPCCGSRPVASVTRSEGESLGQRYLHCGLCNTEWHRVRIQCAHCGSGKAIAFQSLDTAELADGLDEDENAARSARAAQAAVQAETCDDCGHYLKILHTDRDPGIDAVADDLASITLDLLVAETGLQRHGLNLMLLFGDPDAQDEQGTSGADPGSAPPDPGGA